MIIPAWSMYTKSAMTSNLIFFRALLRLVMWVLEDSMNFNLFSLLIGIMTCFLEGSFVVIFNFGLDLLLLLIILWMFLIFKILLVVEDKAYAYDFLAFFFSVSWLLFLKNLDISLTSLGVFVGIGRDNLLKLVGLLVFLLFLDVVLISWIFEVNLDVTFCLKVLLFLSVTNKS